MGYRKICKAMIIVGLAVLLDPLHAFAQGMERPPGTFMPRPPDSPGGNCSPNCPQTIDPSTSTYHSSSQPTPGDNPKVNPHDDPDVRNGVNQYCATHTGGVCGNN